MHAYMSGGCAHTYIDKQGLEARFSVSAWKEGYSILLIASVQ